MSKPDYERIYLVPEDSVWCWAETPAPGAGQSNADAVEYVRADLYQALSTQAESLLDDRKAFVKKEFQLLKEIERLEIELKKRDEQNAALAAQVEALHSHRHDLLDLIYNCAIGQVSMGYAVDAESLAQSAYSITGIDATSNRKLTEPESPQQHLAEIRAEAVNQAATYLSESVPDKSHESVIFKDRYVYISTRYLREYADSIRQEGK